MRVVSAGFRIDEMDRGKIAFAAARGRNAAEAADGDAARRKSAPGEFADDDIERDVVTAHDDEIGHLDGATDQGDTRATIGIERGRERIDFEKAVRLRKAGHRARGLGGWKSERAILAIDQR